MRTSDVCPTCSTFTNALCSIYNGAFLVTLDINTLDSVEAALIKIEAYALSGPVAGLQDLSSVLTQGNSASNSILLSSTTAQTLIVTNITSGDVATYGANTASWGDISNQFHAIFPDRLFYQFDAGGFTTTISYAVPTATHNITIQAGSGVLAFTSDIITDLIEGTTTTTTVDVNSSNGTNATLVAATTIRAGIMTSTKFDEIVLNTAKLTNVSTNLSEGTSTTTTVDVDSSDGTNATLVSATTIRAGILTSAKFDEIVVNTLKSTNVNTDLSMGTIDGTQYNINSSDGTNVSLPLADTNNWGIISDEIFDEIVANNAKITNVSTNLTFSVAPTTVTVESSDGTNAILPEADTTNAGVLGSDKWDEIVANTIKVGFLDLTGHITSTGAATLLGSFTLAQLDTALGTTGTADATTFLRGDNSWATLDQSITDDTTTTYNFVLIDANNIVTLDNAGAVAAILPANGTIAIPVGSKIRVFNKGVGVVTLSVTTDTINTGTGGLTMAQYDTRLLHKITATEWIVGF